MSSVTTQFPDDESDPFGSLSDEDKASLAMELFELLEGRASVETNLKGLTGDEIELPSAFGVSLSQWVSKNLELAQEIASSDPASRLGKILRHFLEE